MTTNKLDKALAEIDKQFGKGSIMNLSSNEILNIDRINTGSLKFDDIMGGGYAIGRIIEIIGWESSGKTTLAMEAIKQCQKTGKRAGFVDMEHAFNKEYAQNMGLNLETLIFTQPSSGEEALEITEKLVRTGEISLIVVDSVTSLVPEAELTAEMGELKMGLQARLMSQAMRKLTALSHKNGCTIIFINQYREKIGVMFGDPRVGSGGNALKFFASTRIETRKTKGDLAGMQGIGIKIKKNKTAPPYQECDIQLIIGQGIDMIGELIDKSTELDIIQKSGTWYNYGDMKLGQGKNAVRELFESNPEFYEEIEEKVLEAIS